MQQEIFNDSTGRFSVKTSTGSEYILSLLEHRNISRRMAAVAPLDSYLSAGLSQLRRDGDDLELLMIEVCRVGAPARFWIQVRNDHIPMLRTTSPVVEIRHSISFAPRRDHVSHPGLGYVHSLPWCYFYSILSALPCRFTHERKCIPTCHRRRPPWQPALDPDACPFARAVGAQTILRLGDLESVARVGEGVEPRRNGSLSGSLGLELIFIDGNHDNHHDLRKLKWKRMVWLVSGNG